MSKKIENIIIPIQWLDELIENYEKESNHSFNNGLRTYAHILNGKIELLTQLKEKFSYVSTDIYLYENINN